MPMSEDARKLLTTNARLGYVVTPWVDPTKVTHRFKKWPRDWHRQVDNNTLAVENQRRKMSY